MSENEMRQHSSYKMLLTSITPNDSSWKSSVIGVDSLFISMTSFISVSKLPIISNLLINVIMKWSSKIYGISSINLNYFYLVSMLGLKSNLKAIWSILLTYDDLNGLFLSYLFCDALLKLLAQ